jgi:hypothetical protein
MKSPASHNKIYVGLTTVLVRRHFTGTVIVGAAWQNERSIQVVLDELKARLQKEFNSEWLNVGIEALLDEDSDAGRSLSKIAQNTVRLGWSLVYRPMEALRQDLESVIRVAATTEKLTIDESCPGGRELAAALDNKVEGDYYDALAICIHQAAEDESVKNVKDVEVDTRFHPFEFYK